MRTSKKKVRETKQFMRNHGYIITCEMRKLIKKEMGISIDVRTIKKYYHDLHMTPIINRPHPIRKKNIAITSSRLKEHPHFFDKELGIFRQIQPTDSDNNIIVSSKKLRKQTSDELIKKYKQQLVYPKQQFEELNLKQFNEYYNQRMERYNFIKTELEKFYGVPIDVLDIYYLNERNKLSKRANEIIRQMKECNFDEYGNWITIKQFEELINQFLESYRIIPLEIRKELNRLSKDDLEQKEYNEQKNAMFGMICWLNRFTTIIIDRLKLEIQRCDKNLNYRNRKRKETLSKQLDFFNKELMYIESGEISKLGNFE